MATRFYLPASGTPPLASLAVDANWELTDGLTRLPCYTTKQDTALEQVSGTWPTGTTQQWVWRQWQSEPLAASYDWNPGDAVSMVIKVAESAAQVDSHLAYVIRIVSEDGTTIRGVVGLYHTISSEYPTSLGAIATRIHSDRTAGATTFTSQIGDRIIIEIGHHGVTPSLGTVYHNYGDPSATEDYALTAGLTTDLCPWVELARTVEVGTPPVTINLQAAQITAQGQALVVEEGAVAINLSPAQITTSGQQASISASPPETSINLGVAQITANAQSLEVQEGPVTVQLDAAQISVQGQEIDNVIPGAVSIPLDAAQIIAQGQPITIDAPAPGIQIDLDAAQITAQGQPLDIQPGEISVPLDVAQITTQGQSVTISSPVPIVINLQAAQITAQAQNTTISAPPPGSIVIDLQAAQITASGQSLDVQPGAVSISLDTAQITTQGQALDVQPGAISISLDAAQINAQGQDISISAPVSGIVVNLDAAQITAQGQPLTTQVGAVSISLDTAIINVSGQPLVVNPIPTPPTPPSAGGTPHGWRKPKRLVVILPEDLEKKRKKQDEEILIVQ